MKFDRKLSLLIDKLCYSDRFSGTISQKGAIIKIVLSILDYKNAEVPDCSRDYSRSVGCFISSGRQSELE